MDFKQWDGFNKKFDWTDEINVRDFIQANYTPYTGDSAFLSAPTDKTKQLWNTVLDLYKQERENGGVLDADCSTPSSVNAHEAGYINKEVLKKRKDSDFQDFYRKDQPFHKFSASVQQILQTSVP